MGNLTLVVRQMNLECSRRFYLHCRIFYTALTLTLTVIVSVTGVDLRPLTVVDRFIGFLSFLLELLNKFPPSPLPLSNRRLHDLPSSDFPSSKSFATCLSHSSRCSSPGPLEMFASTSAEKPRRGKAAVGMKMIAATLGEWQSYTRVHELRIPSPQSPFCSCSASSSSTAWTDSPFLTDMACHWHGRKLAGPT